MHPNSPTITRATSPPPYCPLSPGKHAITVGHLSPQQVAQLNCNQQRPDIVFAPGLNFVDRRPIVSNNCVAPQQRFAENRRPFVGAQTIVSKCVGALAPRRNENTRIAE